MAPTPTSLPKTKAVIFDLIGTCCDWRSSVLPALQAAPSVAALPLDSLSQFALDWRAGFFKEIDIRYQAGQPIEDIDTTHRRVLNYLLSARGITPAHWNDGVRKNLVQAWHDQQGHPGRPFLSSSDGI